MIELRFPNNFFPLKFTSTKIFFSKEDCKVSYFFNLPTRDITFLKYENEPGIKIECGLNEINWYLTDCDKLHEHKTKTRTKTKTEGENKLTNPTYLLLQKNCLRARTNA